MLLRQLLGIGAVLLTESSVHPMLSEKDSSEIVFSLRENIPSYLPKEIDPSSMAPRLVVKYFFDANEDGVRNIAEKLYQSPPNISETLREGTIASFFIYGIGSTCKNIRFTLYDMHTGLLIANSSRDFLEEESEKMVDRRLELFTLNTTHFKRYILAHNRKIILPFRENPDTDLAEIVRNTRTYAFEVVMVGEGDISRERGFFYIHYDNAPAESSKDRP